MLLNIVGRISIPCIRLLSLLRRRHIDQLTRSIDCQCCLLEIALVAGHQSIGVSLMRGLVENRILMDMLIRVETESKSKVM